MIGLREVDLLDCRCLDIFFVTLRDNFVFLEVTFRICLIDYCMGLCSDLSKFGTKFSDAGLDINAYDYYIK